MSKTEAAVTKPIEDVAEELAKAHRQNDNRTTIVKYFPRAQKDTVCLLEVSDSAPSTGEVLPFAFSADSTNGIDYPSVVILLSPQDWQQVQSSRLTLPPTWDLTQAVDL